MLVDFNVLLLLNAVRGSLAEIELTPSDMPAAGRSHWLWMEGNTVTVLQTIGTSQASKRVFDRAVLTLDGVHGELQWPNGRCDALSIDSARALRPEFRRLVHQHLN